jgi:hypothetical protein
VVIAVVTVGPLAMGVRYSVCSAGKRGGPDCGCGLFFAARAALLACARSANLEGWRPAGGLLEDDGISGTLDGVGAEGLLSVGVGVLAPSEVPP